MRTSVFRPQGAGPFPLAVIAHGSTQNEIRRAGFRQPQYTALTEWLVARGYAVAVPLRPGHGETGGPYYEAQGGCANADFARAGQGAASSIEAAIDFLARQAFVRKTGAIALGHSAGGWGALALTTHALRPLAGVVAFAPGSAAVSTTPPEKTAPGPAHRRGARLRREGARAGALAHGGNDSYFPPVLSKRMVDAFRVVGGRVTYELLPASGIGWARTDAGAGHGLGVVSRALSTPALASSGWC